MSIFKGVFSISLFFVVFFTAKGQVDLNLYHFNAIGQSVLLNPATPQNRTLVIGMPGVSQFFTDLNSGVGSIDLYLLSSSPTGNGLIENFLENNSASSGIAFRNRVEPLFLSFKTGRLHWSGGMSIRNNAFSRAPYNLVDLLYNGNASGNGRDDVEIGNFGTEITAVVSYHAGIQIELIKERVFVGGRVSHLNGLAIARLPKSSARLQSNMDGFNLTTNAEAQVAYLDYNTLSNSFFNYSDLLSPSLYITNNNGWAFDLGVHVQVTKKIAVSGSATDIGSIRWEDNATVYRSQGSFIFEGIDVRYSDEGQINTQQFVDSLLSIIEYTEEQQSFTSPLPRNIFLGSKFQVTKRHALAGLYHRQQYQSFGLNSFMIQYYGHIYNGLQLMGSYRITDETDILSGVFSAGVSLRSLRTFQLFVLLNNVGAVMDPYGSSTVGLNFGLNLAFNPRKKKEKKSSKVEESQQ